MKKRDLYKETFSQLHSNVNINPEDYKNMKKKYGHTGKIIAAAASVCIILAASTTVYATNAMGLRDMLIGNSSTTTEKNKESQGNQSDTVNNVSDNTENLEGNTSADNITPDPFVYQEELISLQGFADSNESKAVAEWTNFCDSYDQDGALLAQVGNGPTGLDPKYDLYLVYTQEMADKLDEILEKYNLALHTTFIDISSEEEFIQKAGTGNFLGPVNTAYSTYMYEDGTFHFDGGAILDSGKSIDYQFMNCKKGSFTDVILNIGNIDDYKEWSYETTCGVTVRLAISPYKSLIITDLGDSFITVNVLAGTAYGFLDEEGKITSADLEALADSFDYTLIK